MAISFRFAPHVPLSIASPKDGKIAAAARSG
jgi:hypothetical protein